MRMEPHEGARRYRRGRLDKLGVTGSTPVPPISEKSRKSCLWRRSFESGRAAARDFLSTWDFDAYIAEFRKGREVRRRDVVAGQIQRAVAG